MESRKCGILRGCKLGGFPTRANDGKMTFNRQEAVSPVFSALLLIIIIFAAGILLYNFTLGMVEDLTDSSTTLFSVQIEHVTVNNTCMTIYVGNTLDQDVAVARVYINNEPKEVFRFTNGGAIIPKASVGAIEVVGIYVAGSAFDIKLVFTSGNILMTYVRY